MNPQAGPTPTVALRIRRYEPGVSGQHWETFSVPLRERTTVLDALFYILRERDRSLAFRCACRAAMCGTCGMLINGTEGLACRTPLASLRAPIRVEPLRNLPVIKDLVVDMAGFFDKYAAVDPDFGHDPACTEPAIVGPDDPARMEIDAGLDCVTCGACYSACPMVAADPDFLGPAQLLRAFTLLADEREDPAAAGSRAEVVFGRHGVWRCHGIGECTRVCPKNLDISAAIRRLKRRAFLGAFG